MSEFDRTGNLRRSIRRPKKPQAPAPPVIPPSSDISTVINRLLISQRDFVASPPPSTPTQPRVIGVIPVSLIPPADDDNSLSALMAIQKQINKIEFNSAVQRNETESPRPEFAVHKGRTRYDEMESLLKTGISDLMTNSEDEDGIGGGEKFYRGGGLRSSIQGVPANQIDPKKIKQSRPVARTASDTTKVDIIRKEFKQREIEKIKAEKSADQVKRS